MAVETQLTLKTFQIRNCFGFDDSGPVKMTGAGNLVYVLGRNSSGKTSFLQALYSLDYGQIPMNNENYRNYNAREEDKGLITACFDVRRGTQSAVNSLAVMRKVGEMLATSPFDHPAVQQNQYQQTQLQDLKQEIGAVYDDAAGRIMHEGKVVVEKDGSGHYRFTVDGNFTDYEERKKKLKGIVAEVMPNGTFNVNGNLVPVKFPLEEVEDAFFDQFPHIVFFTDAHSLQEKLPDWITVESLAEMKSGSLLDALVTYLGLPKVKRVLELQDYKENMALQNEMNEKLAKITAQVSYVSGHTRASNLLAATVHTVGSHPGLALTMETSGGPSFYRSISDNTKFLFAYYLYQAADQLSGDILLFDEPDSGFHATAQVALLEFLKSLGSQGKLVIVATHSEHLIDPDTFGPGNFRIMSTDAKGKLFILNSYLTQPTGSRDDFYIGTQALTDAIGLKYRRNLTIDDRTVVAEGITDMLYLRSFSTILGYDNDLHIAPAMSDDKVAALVSLLISQDMRFKIYMDTGTQADAIQRKFDLSDKYIQRVPVPAISKKNKSSGIEDLFSKADFRKLVVDAGGVVPTDFDNDSNSAVVGRVGVVSKRILADYFLGKCREYKESDFEPETVRNFRKALEFLKNDDWCRLGGC